MAFVLSDRIKETTTTTSTGTYTLGGAVSGFETFTANLSNGDTTYYCCTDGTDFEVGLGTFTSSGTTLARTTIISSSNSNNAVNWSSGSRDIFCTLPGSKVLSLDGSGDLTLVGANGNLVFDKSADVLKLGDDLNLLFGDDNDLRIFQSSGSGVIRNQTDGRIYLQSNNTTDGVIITKELASETMAKFRADGPVELYHNNVKKLETTSGGVTITGTLTGDVTGDVTGNVSGTAATVTGAAQTNITSVGTLTGLTTSGSINLSQTSGTAIKTTGNLANGDLGVLRASAGTGGSDTHGFTIKYMGSRTGNSNAYALIMDNQTATDVEAMTVLQDGKVGINNISPSAPLDVSGDAEITGTLTAGEVSATTLDIGGTNITATATEINKLDGVTATTTELNYVDVTTLGTVEASKAVTADANGDVKFSDDDALRFGTGSDLRIFHDGANNIFRGDSNPMFIQTDNTIFLTKNNNAESMAKFIGDGAVELYHNNVKKVETTSAGATVTGNLELISTDAGASSAPIIELYRHSSSPAASDKLGRIDFYGEDDNDDKLIYASIEGNILQPTDGNERGDLQLNVMQNGSIQTFLNMTANTVNINRPLFLTTTGNSIIFEGGTNDTNETTLTVTDPTADRTITFPDATGDVVLNESGTVNIESTADGGPILTLRSNDHSDATDFHKEAIINFNADNDANEEITFSAIEMRPSDVSDGTEDGRINFLTQENGGGLTTSVMVASSQFILNHDDHKIVWNNTKGTTHEVSLTVNTPTASRTITLPDATGEVILTSGGQTMTSHLQFADNAQLRIGDGNDLVIRHDGGHSLIEDNGTGDLYIRASDNLNIQADNGSGGWHNAIQTQFTGSDSKVAFFNGGTQVFSTLSNGISIDVSGGIRFEGATADGNETFLQVADPTADRTITLPDASGTVLLNSGDQTLTGHFLPGADDTYDLGSSSKQWRDIYTGDINLNNTKTRDNEVDGTRGSWTIQEGADDLFLINRVSGKKYKFKLEEIK